MPETPSNLPDSKGRLLGLAAFGLLLAVALSRKPDAILLGLPIPTPRHLRVSEIASWYARWFPFLPGDRALFENPTFKADYRLVRAPITDGREVVLFLRKH